MTTLQSKAQAIIEAREKANFESMQPLIDQMPLLDAKFVIIAANHASDVAKWAMELEKEGLEQARLLGISGSVELKLLTKIASLEARLKVAVEGLEYYGSKSLGETGAWCFRKKFCFDMVQTEDLEFLPEPLGEKGQKYIIGGKRARTALARIEQMGKGE